MKEISRKVGRSLKAVDHMDDGSPICLEITIDEEDGTAVFDFHGTGPEVYGKMKSLVVIPRLKLY